LKLRKKKFRDSAGIFNRCWGFEKGENERLRLIRGSGGESRLDEFGAIIQRISQTKYISSQNERPPLSTDNKHMYRLLTYYMECLPLLPSSLRRRIRHIWTFRVDLSNKRKRGFISGSPANT
jgi:hypothetical protein